MIYTVPVANRIFETKNLQEIANMKRLALVTGGMGGLGEAICTKLGALGYQVVATYSPRNTQASQWLAEMEKQGHQFQAAACDVADYDSAQKCVSLVTKDYGAIDVLINNAGLTRDM